MLCRKLWQDPYPWMIRATRVWERSCKKMKAKPVKAASRACKKGRAAELNDMNWS